MRYAKEKWASALDTPAWMLINAWNWNGWSAGSATATLTFPWSSNGPVMVALIAFPLIFALKSSFYFWNLQMSPTPMGFIGWGNYAMALSGSFWRAIAIVPRLFCRPLVDSFLIGPRVLRSVMRRE